MKAYDLRREELLAAARRKWIFFRWPFDELWTLNYYHCYNHKKQAMLENTAYMALNEGLRIIGNKYKWIRG